MHQYYKIVGATYGEGAYGSSTYGCVSGDTACLAGATTTQGTSGGGTLTNAGTVVLGIVTLACVLIFAALFIRFWRRKRAVHYSAR